VAAAFVIGVGIALAVGLRRKADPPQPPPPPPPASNPLVRARDLLAKDDFEGAAEAVRETFKRGDTAEAHALLGFIQYRKGDRVGARSLLDRAQSLDAGWSMTYLYRGQVHLSLSDWRAARADFDEFVKREPKRADGYALRADARFHQEELAGAIEDAVLALKIDPDCGEAYFARGCAFAGLGRDDEALRDYTRCIGLRPAHVGALVNRGNLRARRGEGLAAAMDWERAVEADPSLKPRLQPLIDKARE